MGRASSAFALLGSGVLAALAAASAGCDACGKTTPAEPVVDASANANVDASADANAATVDAGAVLNVTPTPTAEIAKVVNPEGLPPYSGPTGSVEGTISITGDPAPAVTGLDFHGCPEAVTTYGKLFRAGEAVKSADGGAARALADAIVGVADYKGFYVPETRPARQITIDKCALDPPVVDMTYGQRLEVKNLTATMYAPIIEQSPGVALMVAPPKGADAIKLYPDRAGHLSIADKMGNPWLKGDLWVLRHPLHAVSDLSGHYRIDGVPVGEVTVFARLVAIHKETSAKVTVSAGATTRVDLSLAYDAKSAASAGSSVPSFGPVTGGDAGPRPFLK